MRPGPTILLLLASAGCGEPAFEGTEFRFVIDSVEETITVDRPVRKCDFASSHEGWGVESDDFGFSVADLEPGSYVVYPETSSSDVQFAFDGEIAGVRFYRRSMYCDEPATLTIDGTDYGLTHGTVTGVICSGGTKQMSATFAFATKKSGEERCPL